MNSFQKFLSKFLCVIIIFSGVVGGSERAWGASNSITKPEALNRVSKLLADLNVPPSFVEPVASSLNALFGGSNTISLVSFQNFITSLPSFLEFLGLGKNVDGGNSGSTNTNTNKIYDQNGLSVIM